MRTLEQILAVLSVDRRDEIEALAIVIRQEVQAAIAADREALRQDVMRRAVSDGRGGWMATQDWLGQQPHSIPMGQWVPCVEGVTCNVCGRK